MPANLPAQPGARLGMRIAMLVSQALVYTHHRLHVLKHRLAMAVFHSISDEISEEVDVTLGPLLQKLHDSVDPSHPAYPSLHFMHTVSGQLKALAGTGLQISGLLGSISTIMNNELADVVYAYVRTNPHLLPDPSTLLGMAAAGLIPDSEAQDMIAAQGINSGWSANMLLLARSWPGLTESLELMRRGTITRDQASLWLGLNGIPQDVVGSLLTLQNGPVSVADAALAVLRGNISQAEGEAIALENGFTAASFAILIANTGEPPGLMQLLEGYRRGFIDKATLDRGILESRYRNEWIPLLEQLRYEPMSVADAVNATVQDQLSADDMRKYADENGLQPGHVDILLATAGEPLSRTELEELYNRGLVDQATVVQGLRESRLKNKYNDLAFALHQKVLPIYSLQRALKYNGVSTEDAIRIAMESGYSKADATILVNAGSAERLQSDRDKTVAAVVGAYEGNMIPQADAVNLIEGLGYNETDTVFIMRAAEFRREAHVVSQVVNAVKSKYVEHHVTLNEASGFLDAAGIPATQRDYLLQLWQIESDAYVKSLTEAQITKAVKLQLITPDDGQARLVALGYTSDDAALLIAGA